MKKLRKAVSLVAVVAIMATMFAAPLGANAADETAETNKIIYTSPNLSPNAAVNPPDGFTQATESGAVSNGTTLIKNTYYKTGKDLLGGAGDMTVAYASQAAGTDSKVTINSGAIIANAKNLQSSIDENSRILYEANVNVDSNISSVALMMPAGGLPITNNIDLTNYQGKWINLKIYFQPLMTYTYTVNGGETKKFTTSIMRDTGYSNYTSSVTHSDGSTSTFWSALLSDPAANDTYDSTATYVLKSAVYGNCEAYINGNLVLNSNYPMPSSQSYSTSTIPTRFVFWAADNKKAKTVYYSNIKHSIITNYSSDVQSMSPFASSDKYAYDANNIYIKEGTKLSDITFNDGYEMAAYADMTSYTPIAADGVLADGNTIMVRDENTFQMRGYPVTSVTSDDSEVMCNYADGSIASSTPSANYAKVTAIAGKTSSDTSYALNNYIQLINQTNKRSSLSDFSGYVKVSMNVMSNSNSATKLFNVATNQSHTVSDSIACNRLNTNQWNHIDVIIRLTGNTTDATNSVARTYLNGVRIGTDYKGYYGSYLSEDNIAGKEYSGKRTYDGLRIYTKNASATDLLYVDDINVTKYYLEPSVSTMPEAIVASAGDKASTVTEKGARVYKDSTYTELVTDDTEIVEGNIVVTEQNGLYAYYEVGKGVVETDRYSNDDFALMTSESSSSMMLAKSTANWDDGGIGGKADDDKSMLFTKNANSGEKETDSFFFFNYPVSKAKKYVVLKYNMLLPADSKFTMLRIGTNGNTEISDYINPIYLEREKWYNITNVIEITDTSTATFTTYVNDSIINTGDASAFLEQGSIRVLAFTDDDPATITSMYYDDIVLYTTDETPDITPQQLTSSFSGDIKVADGNTMYIPSNATVAQAKAIINAAYPNAEVRAISGYKVSGNTVLADTDTLTAGDTIVYETTDNGVSNAGLKTISYVTVKALPTNGIIAENSAVKATETATAHAFTAESKYTFVAAEYDKDGNMINIDYNNTNTISITPKTAGNTVKLFLIDDFGTLTPLAENVEIAVK